MSSYGYGMSRALVNEDEPAHTPRRRALMKPFTPESLTHHEPMVRTLTGQYVDRFIDTGKADLVNEMLGEICRVHVEQEKARLDTAGLPWWARREGVPRSGVTVKREYRRGRTGGPARSSGEGPVVGLERRGRVVRDCVCSINRTWFGRSRIDELKAAGKPFDISKRAVWEAWEKVKANNGAPMAPTFTR